MTRLGRVWGIVVVLATTGAIALAGASGQDAGPRDAAVRRHVRALETSAGGTVDEAVARFEQDHFSRAFLARTTASDRRATVAAIRAAAADVANVLVDVNDRAYTVTLEGPTSHVITFTVEDGPPYGIDTLDVAERQTASRRLTLTRETLPETIDRLESDGWSGVIHVELDGDVVLERPFGMANAALGNPMALDTIFGTGSNPIDLTVAAIALLAQDGRLDPDAPVARYLNGVPPDKQAMTVRHLMTGQSGLPDFVHTADDWDPDLAWVDRATVERRILTAPLRFAPGTDRVHSHAAFVLLAALVEHLSGETYRAFVRGRLLDPAGMTRTGFYGETRDLPLGAFAVGGGPSRVGLPNIPPNWGPTSWLVMGSGGMFSTLPDLRRFYAFVRSGEVLREPWSRRFRQASVSLDGSDRGFELFRAYNRPGHEAILMLNTVGDPSILRALTAALERLVDPAAETAGG